MNYPYHYNVSKNAFAHESSVFRKKDLGLHRKGREFVKYAHNKKFGKDQDSLLLIGELQEQK